jgi:hypothetical protein
VPRGHSEINDRFFADFRNLKSRLAEDRRVRLQDVQKADFETVRPREREKIPKKTFLLLGNRQQPAHDIGVIAPSRKSQDPLVPPTEEILSPPVNQQIGVIRLAILIRETLGDTESLRP